MKKRILACCWRWSCSSALLPVMALAAEPEARRVPMREVSKSKTATALDADGSTRVTLSLPSAEEKAGQRCGVRAGYL